MIKNNILNICSSDLELSFKKAFVSRSLFLLNDNDKSEIIKQFQNQLSICIYKNKTFFENKKIILSSKYENVLDAKTGNWKIPISIMNLTC